MNKTTFLGVIISGLLTMSASAQNYTDQEQLEIDAHQQYTSSQQVSKNHVANINRNVLADFVPTAGTLEVFSLTTGDLFFDTGGPGGGGANETDVPGNYLNCDCVTTTVLDGVDEIVFNDFNVFSTFDWLKIYDGPNTQSPVLYDNSQLGANSGDRLLVDMIASNGSAIFNSTGSVLTFEMNATGAFNRLGWEVEVTAGGIGSGDCLIVSDCNLMDTVPDDATSADIWDRPFEGLTCCSTFGPVAYELYGPFTVDTDGDYTILNAQSGWDGFIFLYEDCFDPLDQLTGLIAGNDDAGSQISEIAGISLVTGTDYYIVTTGFAAGDFGDYEISFTGPGNIICNGSTVGANEWTVTVEGPPQGDEVSWELRDNTGAVLLSGGPYPENTNYNDIQTVETMNEPLEFFIESEGPVGDNTPLHTVSCSGNVIITGTIGANTNATFSNLFCETPSNDTCEFATNVECGNVIDGDTSMDTDSGGNAAADEFYQFTGNGLAQNVTLSLCDGSTAFDTVLRVFTDCTLTTEIISNDDSCGMLSELTFESDGTSTYFIMVEGSGDTTGTFSLAVSCQFIDACTVSSDCDLEDAVPNDASSPDIWDRPIELGPEISVNGPVGFDLYGPFTVDVDGDYTILTSYNDFDGYLFLYETCFDSLDQFSGLLAFNDDGPNKVDDSRILNQPLVTGTNYYLVISAFEAGQFGDYDTEFSGPGNVSCDGVLGLNDVEIDGFNYFPNPAGDNLSINALSTIDSVEMYNLLGQVVLSNKIDATSAQIDVSSLTTGSYIMKVYSNGVTGVFNVIKR